MRIAKLTGIVAAALFLATGVAGLAADSAAGAKPAPKAKVKPYPLDVCVVSGEKFGGEMGEPYTFVHEGREIKLCCKSCEKDFKKDTAKFLAKIDAAAKKVKPYALDTCVVSGEKLGDDAFVFVQGGQEVILCCKKCKQTFDKDSAKFLKKIAAAKH